MNPPRIVVDTSVWVAFLKAGNSPVDEILHSLIDHGDIVTTTVILAEITYGAKDKEQFKKYLNKFSVIPFIHYSHRDDRKFCEFRFMLRARGVVTTFTDALIAWITVANNCMLYTLDNDFVHIAKHSELLLFADR
jgi:predicted nucleic acid-binding protein